MKHAPLLNPEPVEVAGFIAKGAFQLHTECKPVALDGERAQEEVGNRVATWAFMTKGDGESCREYIPWQVWLR